MYNLQIKNNIKDNNLYNLKNKKKFIFLIVLIINIII